MSKKKTKLQKEMERRQKEYEQIRNRYTEQLRRYYIARPDWRTTTVHTFWQNYGNW